MSKYFYQCNDCGAKYQSNEVTYLCPKCEKDNNPTLPPKGVLKTHYNYDEIKAKYPKAELFKQLEKNAWIDVLPIKSVESFPKLKVGNNPMYHFDTIEGKKLDFELYFKDDSQNPTYSFKDRASVLVSAFAKENNIETIVAASTGNAGSSLAGLCAANNQKAIIFVPKAAPLAKLTQIIMYGAKIVPVDGTYDNAFDLSVEATKQFGWYNRNTAFNPFTIEGKKTVSFEIFSNLKEKSPYFVFVPVGDGVIISGVYKGFEDLLNLGIIEKMPTIVCVQSDKSKNIVANLENEDFVSYPSSTIADSISVDIPRNFYMAKKFIKDFAGHGLLVTDEEIMQASKILSRNTGLFSEPAATTSFAGVLKYMRENKIPKGAKVVTMLTGSGLKDLKSVQPLLDMPAPIKPDVNELKRIF